MLSRIGYVTSYNKKTRNPNWVAWHLAKEHTDGPYPRKGVPYYADDGSAYGIGVISQETFRNGYFVDLEAEKPRQEHSDWREHPAVQRIQCRQNPAIPRSLCNHVIIPDRCTISIKDRHLGP